MFLHKKITPQQKHGIIVCLPKSNGDRTPDGYRPISLLTTEYTILARIMARGLRTLEENLPGIKLGRSTRSTPVVAYADVVTVFVTQPGDYAIIREAVRCYKQATRAKLNSQKSKALTTGEWSQPANALGIEFHDQVTILGITYGTTIAKSVKDSWAGVLRSVRAQT